MEITEKVLRPVIIDGCNICHAYQDSLTNGSRLDNKFYLDGIGVVYTHFKSLGYEDRNIHIIMKHIPERERSDTFNSEYLTTLTHFGKAMNSFCDLSVPILEF